MPSRPVTAEQISEATDLYRETQSVTEVARKLGKSERTIRRWLDIAPGRVQGPGGQYQPATPKPQPAPLPEDWGAEEIIDHALKRFDRKYAIKNAKKWREIHIPTKKPIVLLFMGDPHLDDDGCNWRLLMRHIEIAKMPNVFTVNIGDTTNNWSGRLERLYSYQESSVATAHKLAKWFMCEAGITWLCWIFGNHDQWGHGAEILQAMNTEGIVMEDWQARIKLTFPNGVDVPIWVAHDFPGHSMWNSMHGATKAARMRGGAHIYACGHKHTWGIQHEENADLGEVTWLIRARGYKYMDHYADTRMYAQGRYGATIAAVIDPNASDSVGAIQCFADPELAIAYQQAITK